MQDINTSPVKVDIKVENSVLTSEGFYQVGFITENDTAPRTLIVDRLKDLLDNGFDRGSEAYNFCLGVFAQKQMERVVVRSKRASESYIDAYLADDNSNYYFVVIESKDINEITAFNDAIAGELKLQFFSSSENVSDQVSGRKLVYYYQPYFGNGWLLYDSSSIVETDEGKWFAIGELGNYSDGTGDWAFDDGSVADWDNTDDVQLEYQDLTEEEAQSQALMYPEGAWIGYCGYLFPSQVQWLYKNLVRVDPFALKQIPNFSNTTIMLYGTSKSTVGTGMTCQQIHINEQVSLDWLVYALQRKLWNLLYTSKKINATVYGLQSLENQIKEILDVSVEQGIFSSYIITERKLDRINNKASFKFSATLTQSILGVDKVEGTIYQ